MTIYKMAELPDQQGYSVSHPYSINRLSSENGGNRYRVGKKNLPTLVNVQWTLNRNGYNYIKAFYELWRTQAPKIEPFVAELIIDYADLVEYQCFFTGGIQLVSTQGNAFTVSASLEVRPYIRDKDVDDLIYLGVLDLVNPLEYLVNTQLPDAAENLGE